jgi:hypothetical protein
MLILLGVGGRGASDRGPASVTVVVHAAISEGAVGHANRTGDHALLLDLVHRFTGALLRTPRRRGRPTSGPGSVNFPV